MTVITASISTSFLNILIVVGIFLAIGTFVVSYIISKKAREIEPKIVSYYTGKGKYEDVAERIPKPKPAKTSATPISFTQHSLHMHALVEVEA